MFSGGALSRLSIFAMGVMPYISASIIIQMMSMVIPTLMELRKEGESGRRKITEYTRYGTVVLAAFQSFAAAGALLNGGMTLVTGFQLLFTATVTMTTGTLFLMWLGEQITERGIGNGISMIILAGIVAGLPGAIGNTFEAVNSGEMSGPVLRCWWSSSCRGHGVRGLRRARTAAHYGELRQAPGRAGACTPGRAATCRSSSTCRASFRRFSPRACCCFRRRSRASSGRLRRAGSAMRCRTWRTALGYGQPLHLVIYALLIIFFCFFYTALVFNARDTADNLKKSGAFIPGIRPGQQTAEYIDKVLTRLTLWGALYVHGSVPAARDSGLLAGRAVPLRRYVPADRRGGGDGLHGAAAGSPDVASVSRVCSRRRICSATAGSGSGRVRGAQL